jgi:hypothetical protein
LSGNSTFVVTDSNRKQAFRWNTILGNAGETLTLSQPQPTDPNNAPLDLFPDAPAGAQTTVALDGVSSISASSYGNADDYLPEDRPSQALDGNVDTAWETGAFTVPVHQWWQVTQTAPVTTDHVTLVQPQDTVANQWITRVTLTFDGRQAVTAALGPRSRTGAGQTIDFPARTFRTLRVTIDRTNLVGASPTTIQNASPVGFAEVEVASARAQEIVDMPSDLLDAAGAASLSHRLAIVMTRQRVAPIPPLTNLEQTLDREFSLPTARTFTLTGNVTMNTLIPDATIDTLVGRPGSTGSGVVAYSSGRLPGDLHDTASSALDGNPSTMWSPGFGPQVGSWISVHVPQPITFDHLDLQVVADGHHSVPTSITISTENGSAHVVLPPVADGRRQDTTVSVPVSFPALTGQQIQVTFTGVRQEETKNYYSHSAITLPIGIAELGIPGVDVQPVPASLPTTCQSDLLTIDGRPVWLGVTGTTQAALNGQELTVQTCGPDAHGVVLGPGPHVVESTDGHATGFDVDQLVLDSAAGGGPQPEFPGVALPAPVPGPAPAVTVVSQTSTTFHLRVTGITSPFWLTLGESLNKGWRATVSGGRSLGQGQLVDGFANGWMVDPSALGAAVRGGALAVTLTWVPQRRENVALVISAGAAVLCLLLVLLPNRWRRRLRLRRHAGTVPAVLGSGSQPSGRTAPWTRDDAPALTTPLSVGGRRPPWWGYVVAPALAGGIAAAVSTRPKIGLAVAAAVLVVLVVRHARALLTLTAVGLVCATAVYVIKHQMAFHFPAGGWPINFEPASVLTWAAVVVLAADAVVEVARRVHAPPVATPREEVVMDHPPAPDTPVDDVHVPLAEALASPAPDVPEKAEVPEKADVPDKEVPEATPPTEVAASPTPDTPEDENEPDAVPPTDAVAAPAPDVPEDDDAPEAASPTEAFERPPKDPA